MKKILLFFVLVLLITILVLRRSLFQKTLSVPLPTSSLSIQTSFHISSSAFQNNESIPQKYTCDGQNINPPLTLSGIPSTAKSLVLIITDSDAPSISPFFHWVLFNISPQTQTINENSLPLGSSEAKSSMSKLIYQGPCPQLGIHHYHFTFFALNETLHLDNGTDGSIVTRAMQGHILAQAELIGLYTRK